MKKQYYYTIMEGNKFLASNLMRGMVDNITEAVRLFYEDDAIEYFEGLNKNRNFKIVEVECILREYEV
ncbi:MAG: hypothetical protein RR942_06435 [Romboutsia sp.]